MSAELEEFAARVAAADETSVGLGPVADTAVAETVDYPETPAAWSLADDEPDDDEIRSWRDAWARAGLIAAAAAGIAAAITVSGAAIHNGEHQDDDTRISWAAPGVPWAPPTTATATNPATTAPPPATSTTIPRPPPPAPTVTVTQTPAPAPPRTTTPAPTTPAAAPRPDRDRQYLADLRLAGITITDPVRVAGNGPRVCAYIAAGHTEQQAVETALAGNPTLTRNNAITVVDAAISIYCPEEW